MLERSLSPEEADEVRNYAESGRRILGLTAKAEPAAVIAKIDDFVDGWPRRESAVVKRDLARSADIIDLSWALGALWGEQLVQQFNWVWNVVGEGNGERYGVVSMDRSLALFPSYFVRECLYDDQRDFTAMLSFNMLLTGRFNSMEPFVQLDIAQAVTRIVPRR